jgi:hypothetical protein
MTCQPTLDPRDLELVDALTDAELDDLAQSAEPDPPLGDDAVALTFSYGPTNSLLPSWYMPELRMRRCTGWRAVVVLAIVATLLALELAGLCSVFGQVVLG